MNKNNENYKRLNSHKKGDKLFVLPLDTNGSSLMCSAVIKQAVRDKDINFFNSCYFEFYKSLAGINNTAEYFINKIKDNV